jgi:Domain of unknown function (DUF4249)
MKPIYFLLMIASGLMFTACEQTISPELETAKPVYVVDAFINNKLDTQKIRITYSQPYFEAIVPPGVSGASVTVKDQDDNTYVFTEDPKTKGNYIWLSGNFGEQGQVYALFVEVNGESLHSSPCRMGRVPEIDSITFETDKNRIGQSKKFYFGQFWSNDIAGAGDTYWIKGYKNGVLLNKPSEINLAYDAGFTKGSRIDGITFIQPIRNAINPQDTDSNDQSVSPYSPGDSVYVEIHSLTEASFDYLNQVVTETNRPGGFSELFARPLANVSTNIYNDNPNGTKAVGFFNVAAVSAKGKRFKQ